MYRTESLLENNINFTRINVSSFQDQTLNINKALLTDSYVSCGDAHLKIVLPKSYGFSVDFQYVRADVPFKLLSIQVSSLCSYL